jgi:hypothetical protein
MDERKVRAQDKTKGSLRRTKQKKTLENSDVSKITGIPYVLEVVGAPAREDSRRAAAFNSTYHRSPLELRVFA